MFTEVDGRRIEARMLPGDAALPVLVFLHEGLGCVALWRDFPDKVARRLGMRALVSSVWLRPIGRVAREARAAIHARGST